MSHFLVNSEKYMGLGSKHGKLFGLINFLIVFLTFLIKVPVIIRKGEADIMACSSPFEIFPKEIWERILDAIEDESGISLALEAIPPLTCLQHCKQFNWRISKLLPILAPKYLNNGDLLNYRLVCKRWRDGVTSAFTAHPDNSAFKSGTFPPSSPFNYQRLPPISSSYARMLSTNLGGDWTPQGDPSWNPFPSHSLRISNAGRWTPNNTQDVVSSNNLLLQALPLLKTYGHHLLHVEFILVDKIFPSGFGSIDSGTLDLLSQCLGHLPNLRSLKLAGKIRPEVESEPLKNPEAPPLPFLETLDISELLGATPLLSYTLHTFLPRGSHPSKLIAHFNQWRPSYFASQFPRISELHLHHYIHCPRKAADLQLELFGNLRKLRIYNNSRHTELTINSLLGIVGHLEGLQVLELVDTLVPSDYNIGGHATGPEVEVALQNLTVAESMVASWDFLKGLRSLQYLTVGVPRTPPEQVEGETSSFSKLVRKYLEGDTQGQGLEGPSIWEELPALKMLTITTNRGVVIRQFARETGSKMFTPKYLEEIWRDEENGRDTQRAKFDRERVARTAVVHNRIRFSETGH